MKRRGRLGFGWGLLCGGLVAALFSPPPSVLRSQLSRLPLPSVPAFAGVADWVRGQAPVLVIDVREPARAAAVRAAIHDERVVAESPHGFALRERRLVVASLAEAGALLGRAGWKDARLQILRFEPRRAEPEERGGDAAGVARLAALVQQPTLTLFEAQQALALL